MQHGVLAREHRKQKKRKRERAGQEKDEDEEDEEGLQENADQGLLLSYSSVDYQHTYDITRLRLYIMRQSLKAELEDRYHHQAPYFPYFTSYQIAPQIDSNVYAILPEFWLATKDSNA